MTSRTVETEDRLFDLVVRDSALNAVYLPQMQMWVLAPLSTLLNMQASWKDGSLVYYVIFYL